jgi:hypothetical protein
MVRELHDLWSNPQHGDEGWANVEEFCAIMEMFPAVEFFHPNYDEAPWHVQAEIDGVIYNFWPHVMKAQQEYCKSVQGSRKITALLRDATATEIPLFED